MRSLLVLRSCLIFIKFPEKLANNLRILINSCISSPPFKHFSSFSSFTGHAFPIFPLNFWCEAYCSSIFVFFYQFSRKVTNHLHIFDKFVYVFTRVKTFFSFFVLSRAHVPDFSLNSWWEVYVFSVCVDFLSSFLKNWQIICEFWQVRVCLHPRPNIFDVFVFFWPAFPGFPFNSWWETYFFSVFLTFS